MELNILIAIVVIFGVINVLAVWFFVGRKGHDDTDTQAEQDATAKQLELVSRQLNQRLEELGRTVDHKIGESAKTMNESLKTQLSESSKIVREVTEGLVKLDETNKQVVSFADQLQNLQDILKNPKQRGVLGEYYLESVLKNVFPEGTYQMQYGFQNGETVDAVVFIDKKIIPIDSKFSLENYNRMTETNDKEQKEALRKIFVNDLKLRIKETAKYIRPAENTTDFAFMFIPSEGIYYDLISRDNRVGDDEESLIQRAANKYKVVIVSPTSLLAYLQTVLEGLRAFKLEKDIQAVIKNVGKLRKHIGSYETYMNKLGNALGTTVNHYNKAHKELKKVDKDVMKITGSDAQIEPLELERPHKDE